jgi:hypothetical protein
MNTCRDFNLKLCPNCEVENIPACWLTYFINEEKDFPTSNKKTIKNYFILFRVNEFGSSYWYREALKQTNPNLVEEIDRLTILY